MDSNNDRSKGEANPKRLFRYPDKGMVAGVAAGMAEYFNVDATIIRVLFVAAIFFTSGVFIIVYFILALIIPTPDEGSLNARGFEERIHSISGDVENSMESSKTRNWIGIALILFGGWLLLRVVFPFHINLNWTVILSVILILSGIWFMSRGRK